MSGLIILPILIAYILFALFIYKLTTSKIVLIVILLFPFWDLIIQKGIKTYYQVFESEPIIYAMPEFDKDGKIESLGLGDVISRSIQDFKTSKGFEDFKVSDKELYSKVKEYIELAVRVYKRGKKTKMKKIRVYLRDDILKRYELIKKQQARYQLIISEVESFLFYKKRYYRLIDTQQNNKLLSESYVIKFANKMTSFRRDILGWQSGVNGRELVYISGINTISEMIKKVLQIKTLRYGISIYNKGWEDE